MDTTQKIAAGLASIVAVGMLSYTPVSADTPEAAPAEQVAALNSTETAQGLTWDMTYGELSPPLLVVEASTPDSAEEDVTDLSMG